MLLVEFAHESVEFRPPLLQIRGLTLPAGVVFSDTVIVASS